MKVLMVVMIVKRVQHLNKESQAMHELVPMNQLGYQLEDINSDHMQ